MSVEEILRVNNPNINWLRLDTISQTPAKTHKVDSLLDINIKEPESPCSVSHPYDKAITPHLSKGAEIVRDKIVLIRGTSLMNIPKGCDAAPYLRLTNQKQVAMANFSLLDHIRHNRATYQGSAYISGTKNQSDAERFIERHCLGTGIIYGFSTNYSVDVKGLAIEEGEFLVPGKVSFSEDVFVFRGVSFFKQEPYVMINTNTLFSLDNFEAVIQIIHSVLSQVGGKGCSKLLNEISETINVQHLKASYCGSQRRY